MPVPREGELAVPMMFRIETERGIVWTTAAGELTTDELLDHKQELADHPDFRPGLRELADASRITNLAVEGTGVARLAQFDRVHAERFGQHKLAIIAPADLVFGMARMYESTSPEGAEVRVFRAVADGRAWLGIDEGDR